MEASELEGRVLRFLSAGTQYSNEILSATLLFLGFSYPGQVTTLCQCNHQTRRNNHQIRRNRAVCIKTSSGVEKGLSRRSRVDIKCFKVYIYGTTPIVQ